MRGAKPLSCYLAVNEIAEKWNITPRRGRAMCLNGQIVGVAKLGREWAIPIDASRPVDGRITTGEFKNWRKEKVQ